MPLGTVGVSPFADPVCFARAATFFANVPWLGIYVGKIPALVRPIQIFVEHGQKSVERRMARGSTTRDLFHYLVRDSSARLLVPMTYCLARRTTRISRIRWRLP